jgi:predicted PurR-regulated permease PerM
VGLGLWNYPIPCLLLELAILFGGLVLYLKTTEPVSRGGGYGMSAFVVVIAVLQAGSLFGPPPPSDKVPAIMGLVLYFALTAIAYWLEKKRQPRL